MTGFDGLVEARASQFARRFSKANVRRVPGADRGLQEDTTGEFALNVLGKGEEAIAKTLGRLFTNNPKFQEPIFGNYATRVGFSELFGETGMPAWAATTLGLTAAIANPLDPLNKLQIGRLTKLGKTAQGIDNLGGIAALEKGADSLLRINTKELIKKISQTEKEIASGSLANEAAAEANKSLVRYRKGLRDQESLNELLVEMQKRGITPEKLTLGKSVAEQIKYGQRKLLGIQHPLSLNHLSLLGLGRGPLDDATVAGLPTTLESTLVSAAHGIGSKVGKSLKPALEKVGGLVGLRPKTEALKNLESQIKKIMTVGRAKTTEIQQDLLSLLNQLIKAGAISDLKEASTIVQALEIPYEIKSVVQSTLDNAITEQLVVGRGVEIAPEGGTALTHEEKLKLLPQGVSRDDVAFAVGQYRQSDAPIFHLGKHNQHSGRLIGEYVVLDYADDVDEALLTRLDGIYGNKGWIKHTTPEGNNYLVAKRLPFSSKIRTTQDFTPDHLFHLENIAAQISTKKLAFIGLTRDDILTSPSGAVQVINPERIVEFKTAKDAVANSRQTLTGLAYELGIPRGPILDLPNLKTVKTARAVPRGTTGMEFRVIANSIDPDAPTVNAQQLLQQSVNTSEHQNYIRSSYIPGAEATDFERANNIERVRQNIREALRAGKQPDFEPIEISISAAGLPEIREGKDRLTAAILEGFDAVPIRKTMFTGEEVPLNAGYFKGKVDRLEDIWNYTPDQTTTAHLLDATTKLVINQQYGVLRVKGNLHTLKEKDLVVNPDFAVALNRILAAGPRFVGKARGSRIEVSRAFLEARFGSVRNGYIALADIAETSPDGKTFVQQLQNVLTNPQTGRGIVLDNALVHPNLDEYFAGLRRQATGVLNDLAQVGAFTNRTITDENRLRIAINAFNDGIVQVADFRTNTLKLYGESASLDHLRKTAEDFVQRQSELGTVDAFMRVELHGVDGVSTFSIGDLPGIKTPEIITPETPPTFTISNTERKALEREGVYSVNAKNATEVEDRLKKKGLNFGVLLKEQFVPGKGKVVVRPTFTYFVSPSGEMFLSTKHKDVEDLLTTVFKEGSRFFQEYGVITPGKIILSNPLGSNMDRLGLGELRTITRRLQEIAGRFRDLGFRKETELAVYVPFDNAIWRSMYGEKVTISDLLEPTFKLRVGKEYLGMAVDNSISTPRYLNADATGALGVTGVEKTRLRNNKLNSLLQTLQSNFDAAFLEEAKRNLPTAYYAGYFGRNLTKKAKEALQDAYLKYPSKESQSFKNLERFFKGRTIGDLTTLELNEAVKRLQKEGVTDAIETISDVVRQYRKGYQLKPTQEVANNLLQLSRMLPEGIDFFEIEPLYASGMRLIQSAKAITRADIVQSIKDSSVVVWSGSVEDLRKARVGTSPVINTADKKVAEAENRLAEAAIAADQIKASTPDIDSVARRAAEKAVTDRQSELADALASRNAQIARISKGRAMDMMVDLQADEAWISGDDATKLIEKGIIKGTDILGDAGDSFVRVPIKKYESHLDGTNTEVFLFPKEVHNVVRQYFGTQTKEGFDKFLGIWDEVHAAWRAWTLFPIPAYHVRNAISSMFMAWLGGVTDPAVYKQSFQMLQLMTSYSKGSLTKYQVEKALESISLVNRYGQVTDGKQIYQEFVQNGGLIGGLHHNEFSNFGTVRRASEFERESVKAGLRPSSELSGSWIYDNAAIRGGIKLAAYTENRFRLATFIDAWTKGRVELAGGERLVGFDAAAIHMKRVFYDYTDLSAFERNVLRRTIPFYSWARFNIPRMYTTLVTEPVIHYRLTQAFNDLERGVTGGPIDEDSIEPWMRERYGIVVTKTDKGSYVIKTAEGVFPMHDAYKLLARGGIFDSFMDGLTPFVKVPIEQITNLSQFTGKEIEKFPGERARSFTLGQLGFSRRATREGPLGPLNLVLNEQNFRSFLRAGGLITDLTDQMLDPREYKKEAPGAVVTALGYLIGKFYISDPSKTRSALYSNWKRELTRMEGLRKYALEVGDEKAVEDLDRIVTHLKLGNPGK